MDNLILVVDDEEDIRQNVAEILELAGYKTTMAAHGKDAIEAIKQQVPDLIVCDVMMPELDGYGVLHLVRKMPATQHVPFLFLTAKTEASDFRKGMSMGADDYLPKPCDDIELLNAVELRLKKAAILQEAYEPGEKGVNSFMKNIKEAGLLNHLLENYETHSLSKRQELYREGKRPQKIFHLLSGKIKTTKIHPDGKEYITNVYTNGDFIGYMPVIEDINYDDSATVLENAELIQIPREDFMTMLNSDATIATKFIQLAANSTREKEERLLNLAYSSLRKRVAVSLLELNKKFNPKDIPGTPLNITRENFARYVGTATESAIRIMTDFRDEKLIDIDSGGRISIINMSKLANLVN